MTDTGKVQRFRTWLIALLAIALLLVAAAWMVDAFNTKIKPGRQLPQAQNITDKVAVQQRQVMVYETVPASVEAKQAAIISSRIMARITDVAVRAGDQVKEGQLLVSLEQKELQAQVDQAREQQRAVTARLAEAQLNLERMQSLRAKGLIAKAELDRAKASQETLSAELAAARNAREQAEAAASFAQIRSPLSGRVVDRFAEPGNTAVPGQKLLSIYNPLSLRIEAYVPERLATSLSIGQQLQAEVPTLDKHFTATIEELVPAADSSARSFLVKVGIGFDSRLLPGMYARLQLPVGEEKQLLVPRDRLIKVGQLDVLWVLENGQPSRRFVRLGRSLNKDLQQVISGVVAGEEVLKPALFEAAH